MRNSWKYLYLPVHTTEVLQLLFFVLRQLHFSQRSSFPFCLLSLIARQNFSLLGTAHDYEIGL